MSATRTPADPRPRAQGVGEPSPAFPARAGAQRGADDRGATDPAGQPVYVPADPHDLFGTLFLPPAGVALRAPVLLCGPFGWEDVSAYRPLRAWAQHLAGRGHPTLRIDLPGTGDSGGDARTHDLVDAWTTAIGAAAAWLAATAGTATATVLGIGPSGLLAVRAAEATPAIGDLALWGVPARGRAVVRQLQAFARLEQESEATDATGEARAARVDERLAPGGYLLSDETQAALRAVDLTSLTIPDAGGRRVLLLERDGLPVDARLREHLERCGATVGVATGEGYGQMTEHPQWSEAPASTIRGVDAWLDGGSAPRRTAPTAAAPREPAMSIDGVRETPLRTAPGDPRVFGILAEPEGAVDADVTAVFLNAGGMRRIGPNRMWVEAARRWAAAGVPSLRLDVGSLGDAPGPVRSETPNAALHAPETVAQVLGTLDVLERRGLPGRFVLIGLSSGAWAAFNAACGDARVRGAVLLNASALIWSPRLSTERNAQVGRRIVRGSQWRRLLRGEIEGRRILAVATAVARYPAGIVRRRRDRRALRSMLRRLDAAGVRISMLFTDKELLRDELERDGHLALMDGLSSMSVTDIPGRDHTLRGLAEQEDAHAVLDAELALLRRDAGRQG